MTTKLNRVVLNLNTTDANDLMKVCDHCAAEPYFMELSNKVAKRIEKSLNKEKVENGN